MAFSAVASAVEGFRVIRREPRAALVWAAALVVLHFAFLFVLFPLARALAFSPRAGPTPDRLITAFSLIGVEVLFWVVLASMMSCAVYRSILRPDDAGLGRLHVGADELRMICVVLPQVLLLVVGGVVALLAVLILIILVQYGLSGSLSPGGPAVPLVLGVLAPALLVGAAWIGVRLSFAGPMTFVEGRLRLLKSWGLAGKRFWPLLGCYAMAIACSILIYAASLTISAVVGGASTGRTMTQTYLYILRGNPTSLQTYLSPGRVIYMTLSSAFSAVIWAVMLAPAAAAYRAIVGLGPEHQAEVFD